MPRSVAPPRPAATRRTASRSCRRPKARSTRCTRSCSASASSPSSTRTARCRTADQAKITAEVAQLTAELVRIRDSRRSTASRCSAARRRRSRSRSAPTTSIGHHRTDRVGARHAARRHVSTSAVGSMRRPADRHRDQQRLERSAPPRCRPEPPRAHRRPTSAPTRRTCPRPSRRIRDVDMAAEMVNFTKQQILQQSGTRCSRRPTRPRRASSRCCAARQRVHAGSFEGGTRPKERGRPTGRPRSLSVRRRGVG